MNAYIEILGMPPTVAIWRIELSSYDLHDIGEVTRENISRWMGELRWHESF
jgi:hypothetical protein